MKKRLIFLILLVLTIPFSSAAQVPIEKLFQVEETVEAEEKTTGSETTYFYAGSKLIATKESEDIKYHYQDRLGSDTNSKSLPFGQEIKSEERFSFTGKELDQDLYYFGARYYDSNLGRFTSVDPVPSEPAYQYVANNPINNVDPTGTKTKEKTVVDIDFIGPLQDDQQYDSISKQYRPTYRDSFPPRYPTIGYRRMDERLSIGPETQKYVDAIHKQIDKSFSNGASVEEVLTRISSGIWDVFEYADHRAGNDGEWGNIYTDDKTGKEINPDLFTIVNSCEGVCYEFNLLAYLVADTSEALKERGIISVPNGIRVIRQKKLFGMFEVSAPDTSYHVNFAAIDYSDPQGTQIYIVDWGETYSTEEYLGVEGRGSIIREQVTREQVFDYGDVNVK
jgi:RHS repeat-associated protein